MTTKNIRVIVILEFFLSGTEQIPKRTTFLRWSFANIKTGRNSIQVPVIACLQTFKLKSWFCFDKYSQIVWVVLKSAIVQWLQIELLHQWNIKCLSLKGISGWYANWNILYVHFFLQLERFTPLRSILKMVCTCSFTS